jgi:peptidoglycan/LPS O-acetylase OafA/YrhL
MRAIAVLAVVANHVSPAALGGGFSGVDVFFVISGYLIGMHLLEDIEAGRFSFLKFYGRRARRLLPALVAVLAAVWGFGWMVLSPTELSSLGEHVAAATVFSNNILLWMQSGYFDTASSGKPLLHLWSLGAEEQFYLLVPLLLWLGARGRQESIAWVARLSVVSFLITELSAAPSFYLLDTRFWELGVGVAIGYLTMNTSRLADASAVLKRSSYRELLGWSLVLMFAAAVMLGARQHPWDAEAWPQTCGAVAVLAATITALQVTGIYRHPQRWLRMTDWLQRHAGSARDLLGVAGMLLIAASFLWVTPAGWPGAQTVFPVLGTGALILAGPESRTNRLLALRPLAFVGGISYPLYLWHWPLIVYFRMLGVPHGGPVFPVLLALLLAWLTKELVEGPARFGRLFGAQVWRPGLGTVAAGLLVTGAAGLAGIAGNGYPSRFPATLRAIANWSIPEADVAWRVHECYFYPRQSQAFAHDCTPPRRPGVPRLLLWGDSHAAHLYPGLAELQKRSNFDLIQWTSAGCPPTRSSWPVEEETCDMRRAWILGQMHVAAPDTVLLAARWDLYESRGVARSAIAASVADDIQWLRSLGIRHIVVFGPGPAWTVSWPMDLFRYMSLRRTERVPERLGSVSAESRELDRTLAAAAAARGAQYVSVLEWFCDTSGCRTLGNESEHRPDLLFRDQDHLTPSGSRDLLGGAAAKVLGAGTPATASAQ